MKYLIPTILLLPLLASAQVAMLSPLALKTTSLQSKLALTNPQTTVLTKLLTGQMIDPNDLPNAIVVFQKEFGAVWVKTNDKAGLLNSLKNQNVYQIISNLSNSL